jgi:hypothetical protein
MAALDQWECVQCGEINSVWDVDCVRCHPETARPLDYDAIREHRDYMLKRGGSLKNYLAKFGELGESIFAGDVTQLMVLVLGVVKDRKLIGQHVLEAIKERRDLLTH